MSAVCLDNSIVTLVTAGMKHLLTVTSIDAESSVVFDSVVDIENNPVPKYTNPV